MKLLINSSEDITVKAWMLIFTEVANLMLSLFNILNFIIYSQTTMAIIHPYFPTLVIHQAFILLHIYFGDRKDFKIVGGSGITKEFVYYPINDVSLKIVK